MILARWVDTYQYVPYGVVPFCTLTDWKRPGMQSTACCYLRSYQSIHLICVSLTPNKHYLNSVSYSTVVWARCCPRNVVVTVFSPTDDRWLCMKDDTNIANNRCFLNHMTVELNFESVLSLVHMNLIHRCLAWK